MPRTLTLPDIEATEALARAIAPRLRAGDMLALSGDLGAGKSTFARALIDARLTALGRREEIPSPTYTLVQTYELEDVVLWHADLYRLTGPDEMTELGLDEAFAQAITLVEWPDRLGGHLPRRRLEVALDFGAEEDSRRASLTAHGTGWEWLPGISGTVPD